MNKRVLLAFFLMSLLWISGAFAQFAGGAGTEDDPWLINTRSQLEQLNNYLGAEHTDKYFKQTNDIDLSASPWIPIGRVTPFYGQYDGDGFAIIGLNIADFQGGPSGLFARITNAEISNVFLVSVNVTLSMDFYNVPWMVQDVAPLAVFVSNSSIFNCHSSGSINFQIINSEVYTVGGLVGQLDANSLLENSSSSCNIDIYCTSTLYYYNLMVYYVGGLVAKNNGVISQCNVTGIIQTRAWGIYSPEPPDPGMPDPDSETNYTGGITSINTGQIDRCLFDGTVTGNWLVGGIAGLNSGAITKSVSSFVGEATQEVGGLVGSNGGSVADCYADAMIQFRPTNMYGFMQNSAGCGIGVTYGQAINLHARQTEYFNPGIWSGEMYGPYIFGGSSGTITSCWWDDWLEGYSTGDHWNAYPHYLSDPSLYEDWDFDNIWMHDVTGTLNIGLPYLRAQTTAPFTFSNVKPMPDVATLAYQFKALCQSFNAFDLSYHWDFGDGNTSTERDPLHIYSSSGVYQVTLTVTNAFDSTGTYTRILNVEGKPANFTASPTIGNIPLTVQFDDITPMIVTSWQWDFNNDGIIDSTEEDPVWTYMYPDTYSVSLTVSNGAETYTVVRNGYITAALDPAQALYVPSQYLTIQAAINASVDGDYIIVADGTYFENLVIEGKNITLASYYFVDGDSSHITNTIIDGSNAINPDQASTITILPSSGRTISQPHISGFTIRSGSGRRIIQNEGGTTIEKRVGGGIYTRSANPIFSFNRIEDNDADDEGGGSYAFQSLPNFGGMVNATVGIRNPGVNRFRNNHADIGSDIYIQGITSRDEIKIQDCSFEVFSSADTTLSNYWATSSAPLSFSGCGGLAEAISADIWVATNGSDTLNNGLSPLSPFKTIDHALSRIYATAENPLVIHIASGTYSPSLTGEKFPLQMVKHVSLLGAGKEETFLDAEGSADFPRRVLNLDKVEGVQVSGLTLMNGFVTLAKNYNGGAIGILASQVALSDLIVAGSSAAGNGAGIYALDSSVEADSLVIQYNSALGSGGGIHSVQTNLNLSQSSVINNSVSKNGAGLSLDGGAIAVNDCEISYNQATGYQSKGGGISLSGTQNALFKANLITHNNADNGAGAYLQDNSAFHLDRNRFSNNLADYSGGGLFINTSSGLITNNQIAGNTATQRGGALYCYSALQLVNNTIAYNKAGLQGGALYLNSASPSITNTIVWGNVQGNPEVPNQIYLFGDTSDPEITFCDVQGGMVGFGTGGNAVYTGTYLDNQDQDPLFDDTPEGAGHYFEIGQASLSLSDESPAIDAGDTETDVTLFPLDIAGSPRLDNARIDLGAWEAVHFVGARIAANPPAIDFGRVNISGEPVQQQISLSNTGNQALLISDITLETPATEFTWTFSGIGTSILPGESLILEASFDPQQVGLVSNALLLSSNSLNSPILRIPLRGYGIDASSSQPSNVVLQVSGYDVNISWDPVLSDPLGNPFTPEGYIVLYSETINATLDDYLYLTFSTGTSAVHPAVARFQDRMFYRVIAVDGSTRSTLENLLSSAQRTRQPTWREIKLLLHNRRSTLQTSSSPLSKER